MITCSRCNKENQDHYKFCLGCGTKLEAAAPAPVPAAVAKTAVPAEPGAMLGKWGLGAGSGAPPSVKTPHPVITAPPVNRGAARTPTPILMGNPAAAPTTTACPTCGKNVPPNYAFCGSCGHRMKAAPPAAAIEPANSAQRTMYMTPAVTKVAPRGHLTLIRPDGSEGGTHPLQEGGTLIGRGQGPLFDADPYLSPRHAELTLGKDGLTVEDLRSLNGVFVKISREQPLQSGDIFRVGQELLRFDSITPASPLEDGTEIIGTPNPGYWGRVSIIVGRESDGSAFPLQDAKIVLGRERGNIVFPEDGYVSGSHAQIEMRDGQAILSDLGSSNGTFYQIREPRTVPSGTLLLIGQQLFRASFS